LARNELISDELEDLAQEGWAFTCDERFHRGLGVFDAGGIGLDCPMLQGAPVQPRPEFQIAGLAFVRGCCLSLTLRRKFTIGA
jgi:hypothetical protein